MPKLRMLSGRDVCKILSEHGFAKVRQKGSHIIMQKRIENRNFIGDHQTVGIVPFDL